MDEADSPPLLKADFDCLAFAKALDKFSLRQDNRQPTVLHELYVAKVKLCILVGSVLRSQYERRVHCRITSTEPTMLFLPKLSEPAGLEHRARDQELCNWNADF